MSRPPASSFVPETPDMPGLTSIVSRTVVLPERNIDTDQIIPARFLTTTQRKGLGQHAFSDWRRHADGTPDPGFPFNQARNAGARILVAGHNFGCGSSREHAPWALLDLGLRAVVSSQIADIFRSNALKNGLLPVVLEESVVVGLLARPGIELAIDVATATVTTPEGERFGFALDPFSRTCLLEGVDQLGYLLRQDPAITRFEAAHAAKSRDARARKETARHAG